MILEDAQMFFRKSKRTENPVYDKTGKVPVIRASICTGEKVAGFKDEITGKFEELMLIRNDEDKHQFMLLYGVGEGELKKEW